MTPARDASSPIVRFLGEDAGAGGPFALLGLPHSITSAEQITRAADRRLHQIQCHRLRSTPDAQEVRLAIHTAASQLRDPALREELARRWPEGNPQMLPKAWKAARSVTRLTPAFVSRARMIVGSSGGWNPTARKRLAHLARLNRVSALELIRALSPAPAMPRQYATGGVSAADRPTMPELIVPPQSARGQWMAAYALLAVMAGLLITAIFTGPTSLSDTPATGPRSPIVAGGEGNGADPADIASRAPRARFEHYSAIAHELELLAASVRADPDAGMERLSTIYPHFRAAWTEFPAPDRKRAALHIAAISSAVLASTTDERVLLVLFTCPGDAQPPAERMINAAVIDVVLSSPEISPDHAAALAEQRTACIGSDARPTPDITEALVLAAGQMGVTASTEDSRWWEGWLQGVRAATTEDPEQRTRLILDSLSVRMRDPASPDGDMQMTARLLTSALSWREQSDERLWLLSQFGEEAVSTPRLAALTEAVATASGAERIDASMVLAADANTARRQQLADEYRRAWAPRSGQAAADVPSAGSPWVLVEELRLAVAATGTDLDDRQAMDSALELANLNAAAWLHLRGEQPSVMDLLDNPRAIADEPRTEAGVDLAPTQRDTDWAEEAINAENASQLLPLFDQLAEDDGPGVNSAHALVHMASLHPDSEIRALAGDQLVRFRDRAPVLIALDHAVSTARVSSRLEELVGQIIDAPLPLRTDPQWFDHAHRVILSLLARAMATETDLSDFEELLADLYALRLPEDDPSPEPGAVAHARALAHAMRIEAGTAGNVEGRLAALDAATAARLARASSPPQRFLAYQQQVLALLMLRADQQLPGASAHIEDISWEMETRLGSSASVIDQIAQTERAIAQIMTTLLGRESR